MQWLRHPRRLACSLMAGLTVLVLASTGCARAPRSPVPATPRSQSDFPVTLTDDEGVSVTMEAAPRRIVTFAPSNTEILFALGLGSRVVGVSGKFDDYPPAARHIDRVGGAGEFGADPNAEKVVSLHPDLMLAISGGEEWKKRLRDLGITIFTVNATDLTDLLHDIDTIGRLTGATSAASRLTARMSAEERRIERSIQGKPVTSCFFEAYYPPLTTVGPHTFIFDLLRRAGCDPVSSGARSDYPEWSVDKLVEQGPSVYLVASESGVSPQAVAKRPGFGAIEAIRQHRVYLVDSDLVARPGPRVVQGLAALARDLHP